MPYSAIAAEVDKQVQQVAQAALNLLFPPRCAGCRKPGTEFCDECAKTLVPTGSVVCTSCGEPLSRPGLCLHCKAGPRAFRHVRSAFRFEGPLRQAVHALKYEKRRSVAAPLAGFMGMQLAGPDRAGMLLCAVPLHPGRQKERGFNQSAELARYLGQQWGVVCLPDHVLQRIRATERQVELDQAARQANVEGAFGVSDSAQVLGRGIILVDDVCTTGATLDACAQALRSAGASVVDGVTLARQV
jgi:ComF family protein